MIMYYAVIDTNVLVSALLKRNSAPWQVAEESVHVNIIPLVNEEIQKNHNPRGSEVILRFSLIQHLIDNEF